MAARFGIIYIIYCIPEDKCYIGQTDATLERRKSQHYRAGKYKEDDAMLIDQILQYYDEQDFIIQEIERCDIDKLNEREMYWIAHYDCMEPKGYNRTKGGGVNRRPLSPDQIQALREAYIAGDSLSQLGRQYDISTDTVRRYLQQMNIPIRTLQEQQQFNNSHQFYRMDAQHNVLQTYNSFSEIGQWLIDNGYTHLRDASHAGVSVRHAMLFEYEKYGYLWDTDLWTDEEREENKQKSRSQSHQVHTRKSRVRRRRPTRSQLMAALSQHHIDEVANDYGVQSDTVRKWCKYYYLAPDGSDLSQPCQNVPETYIIKRTVSQRAKKAHKQQGAARSKCPADTQQMLYDIATSSMNAVARRYAVSSVTVARWCKQAGLPSRIDEIRRYVCESYGISLDEMPFDQNSVNRRCTPDNPSGRYPANIDDLLVEIATTSFEAVGRKYGVHGNAVKKWCRNHDRPWRIKEVRAYVRKHHLA